MSDLSPSYNSSADTLEIQRLIVLYSHLLDDQKFDSLADLLFDDCRFVINGNEIVGKNEVMSAIVKVQPEVPGVHFVGLPVVEFISENRAHAWTDMVTFFPESIGGALNCDSVVRYQDVIERQDGRWIFLSRYLRFLNGENPVGAPEEPTR